MKKKDKKLSHQDREMTKEKLNSNEELKIKGLEKEKDFTDKLTNADDIFTDKMETKKTRLEDTRADENTSANLSSRYKKNKEDSLDSNSQLETFSPKDNIETSSWKENNFEDNSMHGLSSYQEADSSNSSFSQSTSPKLTHQENKLRKTSFRTKSNMEVAGFKADKDYSNKVMHLDEKYTDKMEDSKNKLDFKAEDALKEKNRKANKRKNKFDNKDKGMENEVYDPLGKDLDNDGILDRNDSNTNNADYYSSSYDVETQLEDKEHFQKSKLRSKKKNFRDGQLFTRNKKSKEDILKEAEKLGIEKANNQRTSSLLEADPKIRKMRERQEKLEDKLEKTKKSKLKSKSLDQNAWNAAAFSAGVSADYLSHGSDENVAVEGTERGLRRVQSSLSKLSHGKNTSAKKSLKKQKRLESKIVNRKSKLEYRSEIKKLSADVDFEKKSAFKKFIKRKQMKNTIAKKYSTRFRDKIKMQIKEVLSSAKQRVISHAKKSIGVIVLFLLGLMLIFQAGSLIGGGLSGFTQSVMASTYLSSETTLSEINQEFSSYEYELLQELENVENKYPGYDEYNINGKELIGHNTHELLSYITAHYGEIKDTSEITGELAALFNALYKVKYEPKTETRYRTVSYSYTDAEGNEHSGTREEAYEYKILNVRVEKKELDTHAREVFASYEDNLKHYETLLATKGNMGDIFGSSSGSGGSNGSLEEIVNSEFTKNPGIEFTNAQVKQLFGEAERHLGKRYVFGANGPGNFDCSSFVCWSFTKSGIKNMPRTTAWLIYKNYTTPISPSDAKPGDIIFFKGTYNSGAPISHVGIYAGNGMMIHAGDPIQYTSIHSNYWKNHFYAFGRP